MSAIAYVNGSYRALRDAVVNIEDRGYQFGDGIYEVIYVHDGRLVDAALHLARLTRSLHEIELGLSLSPAALTVIIQQVLRRNRVSTGLVYIQVTRGVARRDHAFPSPAVRPSLVVTARHRPAPPRDSAAWAGTAICLPDERWGRCDIKSTNLLPNVLARQKARLAGAYEAILYNAENMVTEGAASSVWVVDSEGTLLTRQLDRHILPGCTRAALIEELSKRQIRVREAPFTLDTLRTAREIFLTSASSFVKPIIRLDDVPVADGHPGPVASMLFDWYRQHIETE
jgi:D-alanine transaminase